MHVVGVDFSEEVINANKSRYPDIDWLCLDAGTPGTPGAPRGYYREPYLIDWDSGVSFLCFSTQHLKEINSVSMFFSFV